MSIVWYYMQYHCVCKLILKTSSVHILKIDRQVVDIKIPIKYDGRHINFLSKYAMRYSPEQKIETHKQIVGNAAREFRSKGLQGIGIADLMSQVGLTHGGFYAHFKDRDSLVAEASICAATDSFGRLLAIAEAALPGEEVSAMLDFYLSPEHRDEHGYGCVLPALAADLARQPDSVRNAFTGLLKENLEKLSRYMPAEDARAKLNQAMMLISGMAGGILIARAMNDPMLSKLLLESVRTQLLSLYKSWRI
jgi:TetR/AcrR family transcriptional repressor of nem operon